MSRTYRDVLDERKVPKGPWCVHEDRTTIGDRNPEGQDPEEGLGAEHESPGSAPAEIAKNVYDIKDKFTSRGVERLG